MNPGRLTIGRVGLDVLLRDPQSFSESADTTTRTLNIRGDIKSTSSLAAAKALRTELRGMVGKTVAVTYDNDTTIDGFYRLESVSVETTRVAYVGEGFFPFNATLTHLGQVVFQSGLTGDVLNNLKSISWTGGYLAPPVGFTSYTPSRNWVTRTGSEGPVTVFRGIQQSDHPVWTVDPANFYRGSSRLLLDGFLRSGEFLPIVSSSAWELNNTLVRVRINTGGTLKVANHTGTKWSEYRWAVLFNGFPLTTWSHLVVLRNDPEAVAVRLVKALGHADGAGGREGGEGRITLDLHLRRGSRFVSCLFASSSLVTPLVLVTDPPPATSTQIVSGGADVGVRRTTNDPDGNQWVVLTGSPTLAQQKAIQALNPTAWFDFAIGSIVGGDNAASGDQVDDLQDQYFSWLEETVRHQVAESV